MKKITYAVLATLCIYAAGYTATRAQQKPPANGDEYIEQQLAVAQHDVKNLLNQVALMHGWIDKCVKDFKACEDNYKKEKDEADKAKTAAAPTTPPLKEAPKPK